MNLAELIVKITADDSGLSSGLNAAEGEINGYGEKTESRLGKVGKVVGKATLAAVGALAAGVGAMTKSAIQNYAEYEQLVGGVETLFKDSAGKVQEYANNAYKTAGMSANEYMETVTSFSASLLQSVGGDTNKAAEAANLAITDMSDNANKMGTSMESITNAYQGFAKQNYTMLDNLKLGYGGTKEEMQRLLNDAEKLSGKKFDLSSYADIVDAIHVVQTEMGITGTTALEASTTIEGSFNSLKASWQNLLTGFGDSNANLSQLVDNVVQNATQVATNVAPIALNAFTSIGTAAQTVAPMIIEALPQAIDAITNVMLQIINGITNNLPKLMEAGIEIIVNLVSGISKELPTLIPKMVQAVTTMVTTLLANGNRLVQTAGTLIKALATGIINSIPIIIKAMPQIISGMVRTLAAGVSELAQIGGQLITGLWNGINNKISWVIGRIKGMGQSIINAIKGVFGIHSPSKVFAEIGKYCVEGFAEGFEPLGDITSGNSTLKLSTAGSTAGNGVVDAIDDLSRNMYGAMSAALDNHVIEFNGRELGRMVKSYV